MAGIKNKYDFYKGFLEALGAEGINETDYKNEEELRKKILDALDVEYVFDDVNQTDLFREKFLQGISSGGGGGSSDFSTATVTYETDQVFPLYMARADDLMEGLTPMVRTEGEYIVPLYKGKAFAIWSQSIEDLEIETTGDITFDSEHKVFTITGDGTISIF